MILVNTLKFLFLMLLINVFISLFGPKNTLPGVAAAVGLMTFPALDLEIKPFSMALLIFSFYTLSGLAAQSVFAPPLLGFIINFAFVLLLLIFTSEPAAYKIYMPMLLAFIFGQSVPVSGQDFILRMEGLILSGIIIALSTVIMWKLKGFGKGAKPLKEQIAASKNYKGFILRLSVGIALAMLIGTLLNLQKPLWISIVVMSLTQIELQDTITRIKHRTIATFVGIAVFIVFFHFLIPPQYHIFLILLIGYLNNFVKEYKYQQILNAVNAINASLILLDTSTAIKDRLLCLAAGIFIVLMFYGLHFLTRYLLNRRQTKPKNL
ncbi:MAG: FUSC family protein [Eubacterium sp.]